METILSATNQTVQSHHCVGGGMPPPYSPDGTYPMRTVGDAGLSHLVIQVLCPCQKKPDRIAVGLFLANYCN